MNGNDHSDCPVELRPCPEHKVEHERHMAEAMSCEQTEIEKQGSTARLDPIASAGALISRRASSMQATPPSLNVGTSPTTAPGPLLNSSNMR
jgi:hypothetical protein